VTRLKRKLDSVRLDIVLTLMQDRCTVCAECTKAQKSFWTHPMELQGGVVHVLIHLETVLVFLRDRCRVCAKHTIGSEIILDAPDRTPRRRQSCGISFSSIWRQC
jgi:hypothetical protein